MPRIDPVTSHGSVTGPGHLLVRFPLYIMVQRIGAARDQGPSHQHPEDQGARGNALLCQEHTPKGSDQQEGNYHGLGQGQIVCKDGLNLGHEARIGH